jgi:integrase
MTKPKKKDKSRYARYIQQRVDGPYAIVNLPLGNGKYRKELKKIPDDVDRPQQWAQGWAVERLRKHRDGEEDQAKKRKNGWTFSAYADIYCNEYLIAPVYQDGKKVLGIRTYRQDRTKLQRLERYFGHYPLDNITFSLLRTYKKKRILGEIKGLKPCSVTSVNRDFALMRTLFNRAVAERKMRENPFKPKSDLIAIALESQRQRKMTPGIAARLLARSRKSEQPLLHYLILTMRHTGARPSELYEYQSSPGDNVPREPLTWKNILEFDFKALRLIRYKGKIRREKIVPTSLQLERGLRELYAKTPGAKLSDPVFPFTSVARSWRTLCKSARVTGVVLRDFRSFFNQELADNPNIDEVTRMLIIGHDTLETNLRYSFISQDFLKNYRNLIGQPEPSQVIQLASSAVN